MKKILTITLLIVIFLLTTVGFNNEDVNAENDKYAYACSISEIEVDEAKADGTFELKACYNTFDEAYNSIKNQPNYVVRGYDSKSPMKIIAMNGGLAYIFSSSDTLKFYEKVVNNKVSGKSTYSAKRHYATYLETERYFQTGSYKGCGMVKVNLNGFVGYTDLEEVDLVPYIFIENEVTCKVAGGEMNLHQNYYYVNEKDSYRDLVAVRYRAIKSNNNDTKIAEGAIGVAPDFMKTNTRYYSLDGVRFYSDQRMTNYVGSNYNYYQFLSLRSKSNVTALQLKNYLISLGYNNSAFINDTQAFIDAQNKYGVNALLMFALACNESAYGTSLIQTNNIFGLGAFDGAEKANAYVYNTIADCINSFAGWSIVTYLDPLYQSDSGLDTYNSSVFGNKGVGINLKYASDPYESFTVSAIAYRIDKYISGGKGKLTDYNYYSLALINKDNVDIKKEANDSSTTLYKSTFGQNSSYQKDHVVIVFGQSGDYTKIVSSANLDSNRNPIVSIKKQLNVYNFENSYAYIKTSDLDYLNNKAILPSEISYETNVSISWNNNNLKVNGSAYQKDLNDTGKVYIRLNNKDYLLSSLTNNKDFNGVLNESDLTSLPTGQYSLTIKTSYDNYSSYSNNKEIKLNSLPSSKIISNKEYSFMNIDNKTYLKVTNYVDNPTALVEVSNIELNKSTLEISGVGVIKGVDSKVQNETKHQLVLINYKDNTKNIVIDCVNESSSWYKINDGCDYSYAGFSVEIDLNNLENFELGSYGISVKVTNGKYAASQYLKYSFDSKYSNLTSVDNNITYRISNNEEYSYRIELDALSTIINYSSINKNSYRESLVSFDSISLEDGHLMIQGQAFMYKVSYENNNNISYKLYLINSYDNSYIIGGTLQEEQFDYTVLLNSKYSLKNISYVFDGDLSNIQDGEYKLYIQLINDSYNDFVVLDNPFGYVVSSVYINNRSYSIYTSNVKDQLILKVETK